MPTLTFSDDFSATERRIYAKTFTHACRELGISEVDATVILLKEPYDDPRTKGCIRRLSGDCFRVGVNSNNDHFDGTFALCHETVHIKQFVVGEMGDHPSGVIWRDRLFPTFIAQSPDYYMQLPWEQEAHGKAPALHDRAMRCLNFEEIISMINDACERQVSYRRD